MAKYRIVCTEQVKGRIVAVGTGSEAGKATTRLTLGEVVDGIQAGDEFYTKSVSTGKTALVELSIRSSADAVKDNNLDNLRSCSWKS